jgi:hypothetical protein
VGDTRGIPKFIDIFLRKEETSVMIAAMRNSIAESSATAPTTRYDGLCNQNGFAGARGKFYSNRP